MIDTAAYDVPCLDCGCDLPFNANESQPRCDTCRDHYFRDCGWECPIVCDISRHPSLRSVPMVARQMLRMAPTAGQKATLFMNPLPRMRGVVGTPTVRAQVLQTTFRHLSDGVPYLEVTFRRLDTPSPPIDTVRARYWLTPGGLPATLRGLAAVGLALDLDADDAWTIAPRHGPAHTFDLPLVEVECPLDETHGVAGVVRTFVAHPARNGALVRSPGRPGRAGGGPGRRGRGRRAGRPLRRSSGRPLDVPDPRRTSAGAGGVPACLARRAVVVTLLSAPLPVRFDSLAASLLGGLGVLRGLPPARLFRGRHLRHHGRVRRPRAAQRRAAGRRQSGGGRRRLPPHDARDGGGDLAGPRHGHPGRAGVPDAALARAWKRSMARAQLSSLPAIVARKGIALPPSNDRKTSN